jgi:GT2 family glycosyltransferase
MNEQISSPGDAVLISVVIVTWNSASDIEGCMASLLRESSPETTEFIVVDNASSDRTVEIVRTTFPEVHVIANESNGGLAAANNQGMSFAQGSHFLICNPDVVFQPGSVGQMMEVLERHDNAAWVVPRFVHEDGVLQTSVGDLPTLAETLLGRQVTRRRARGEPTGFWWDGWAHDTERPVGRGLESAYVVRRRAVEAVGMQDEKYVLDWEGIDWAERFHRNDWEVWFAPRAEVLHLGGTSRRQVPYRSVVSQHRGMYYYFSDRGPRMWKPFLALAFALRAAIKMSLTVLGVPFYSWAHRDRKSSRE